MRHTISCASASSKSSSAFQSMRRRICAERARSSSSRTLAAIARPSAGSFASSPSINAHTDEHAAYRMVGKTRQHGIVIHGSGQYVKGDCHSNSIENFWSLFKRGLIGSFHQISVKHLTLYLNEFQFRFNNREAEDLFALVVMSLVVGSPLPRAVLMANARVAQAESDDQPFLAVIVFFGTGELAMSFRMAASNSCFLTTVSLINYKHPTNPLS